MPKTPGKILLEQQIMLALQGKNMSLRGLSDELKANYYTVREAVNDLYQEQKVVIVSIEDRHRIYGLTSTERINDKLPYLSNLLTRTQHKFNSLLAAVGREGEMQAVDSVKKIPRLVTEILHISNQAEHGFPVGEDLNRVRKEMQENYLILKNATSIYEQILEDPRYWTPKYLKEFVHDPDFNYPDIVKAKEYYDNEH